MLLCTMKCMLCSLLTRPPHSSERGQKIRLQVVFSNIYFLIQTHLTYGKYSAFIVHIDRTGGFLPIGSAAFISKTHQFTLCHSRINLSDTLPQEIHSKQVIPYSTTGTEDRLNTDPSISATN